jgi:8-oxo-dGTP diphosphatase
VRRALVWLWRLLRPFQWRILWLLNAQFMVGVSGVVRNEAGQVLLLKHRMWSSAGDWGVPTGYAKRSERLEDTVVREVREETGLEVRTGALIWVRSGFKFRVEVAYEAELVGGTLKLDPFEILDAKWFEPDALPEGTRRAHRVLVDQVARSHS